MEADLNLTNEEADKLNLVHHWRRRRPSERAIDLSAGRPAKVAARPACALRGGENLHLPLQSRSQVQVHFRPTRAARPGRRLKLGSILVKVGVTV